MWSLVVASVLWAYSFPLIRSAGIDPDFLAAARLALAALVFAPLLRPRSTPRGLALRLLGLGALQYGAMYVLVLRAYEHLEGHEVALLTATTPVWVVAFGAALEGRVGARVLAAAVLAAVAAAVVGRLDVDLAGDAWRGVLLVQGANALWAAGQVLYRRLDATRDLPHARVLGWLFLGGALVAGAWGAGELVPNARALDGGQVVAVLYLGLVPSGVAFYLWQRGATQVPVGTLAVTNNLKVPLAVAVALLPPFLEPVRLERLALSAILLALALAIAGGRRSAP